MSETLKKVLKTATAKSRAKLNLSVGENILGEAGPSKTSASPKKSGKFSPDSEDSSSGDENLVSPSKLDLASSFFEPIPERSTPHFECNIGIEHLSASEEEHDMDTEDEPSVDIMENLNKFAKNLDDAKENLQRYESRGSKAINESSKDITADVKELLALGEPESSKVKTVSRKKKTASKKAKDSEDESDWEEVKGKLYRRMFY